MHLVFVSGQIPLAHCAAEGVGALIESHLVSAMPSRASSLSRRTCMAGGIVGEVVFHFINAG